MFFTIGVIKNFTNFIGKHLCASLFLIKLQAVRILTLSNRDSNTMFSIKICAKFLRTLFFTEHLWWLLLMFGLKSLFCKKTAKIDLL